MLLVKARKAAGITQQELAAKAGTTQSYIAKLESGEANPTIGKVGEQLALLGFRPALNLTDLNPYAPETADAAQDQPLYSHTR